MAGLLPGGPLSEKFGGEWVFGIGVFLMSVSSLLVPVVASSAFGAEGLIVLRIICGFGAVRSIITPFFEYHIKQIIKSFTMLQFCV